MTLHRKSIAVQAAALHLVGSAIRTKDDGGNPLETLSRKFGDHAAKTLEKLGATNDEIKALRLKQEEHDAHLLELGQKMARGSAGGTSEPDTIGKQFVENPDLKAFADRQGVRGRFDMQVKATITTATGSAGALTTPYRDELVTQPQRRLTIRDLMPVVNVSTGVVEYPRVVNRPTAAGMVAEAALKPESELTLELIQTSMKVIAHWIPASRQILDDAPQLRGVIDTELLYGLKLKEEEQLLNGSGTGQNLNGMVTQATAYVAPITIASPNMLDVIGLGILQTALTDLEPDGVVVSSADWMRMRLLKDADGHYLLGAPGQNVAQVLFGLPVVHTPAMSVDKFLVGAFQAAGTIYDRWQARIEVSTEHADFFVRNMVAILCEERIGLAIKRAKALTYGDFGNEA
ncbi:phage major capsid protein [Tianweitania sp. BSSL-BM11]|uniref:Phage major capsid protein n=1 Tax=Tianweitania aestuarii TaxID=2814886 RepID=A0ABS5RTA0_9HYPH|nr:phage major capsid protein [Tianweitania aestuarii]MBS9720236.1 phage major capsid protein [Tianweitania aestuarii]